MSIASEITRLQQAKADIKTAIEGKGVTVPSDATLDAYDGYIDDIEQGGGGTSLEDKPVIYIDYDGSVVYGYTAEEFAQLTEHPANPDHSGDDIPLTSQGWNWTLSDAQTYVAANGYLVIGQMYITTDGATYIGIDTTKSASDKFTNGGFKLVFYQYGANNVSVDWGDNSPIETNSTSGNGVRSLTHTYATDGKYVIKLTPVNDSLVLNQNLFDDYANNDRLILYDAITFVRYGRLRNGIGISKIGRKNLGSITIPSGITSCTAAFVQMSDILQSITLPSGFTSIGQDAFSYSIGLKYISVPNSLTTINSSAFIRCLNLKVITLPSTMSTINANAFQQCISIEKIIMPRTITTLGTGMFTNCYSLKHANLPTNITSCPSFSGCASLESIELPSTITYIGASALASCWSLENYNIPNGVTAIGGSAFRYIYLIKKITIPDSVTTIGDAAFQDCNSLEELVLSKNLASIPAYAFGGCYRLKELILPDSITAIGQQAFNGCFCLKNITIPNNVTTIGNAAFQNCTAVETITIGESVTSIGTTCFSGNYREKDSLHSIYMLPQNPPSIASSSFSNLGDAFTIYVPQGRLSAYQSATNWTTLASKMVEMTT